MKQEKCWVIQRDDGSIEMAGGMFESKKTTQSAIKLFDYTNCKPVKVEIKVVQE